MTSRILEGDWQALTRVKSIRPEIGRLMATLLSLKGKSSSFLRNVRASFPKASRGFRSSLEDFIEVTTLLDDLGCKYEIDITAVHGFEYYTGICFQFLSSTERIGGGGRYDNLVPLMNGKEVPACGFALYVDHIMRLLPTQKERRGESGILIKGKVLTPEVVRTCFSLARSLREAGHTAELSFAGRETSDHKWVVSVSGGEPSRFVVKDCIRKRRREAASVAGVLEAIGKG